MSPQPHDQFAKTFLAGFLDPLGDVEISHEISGSTRWADLYFQPAPAIASASSPWINLLLSHPCLIEPYRNPIQTDDIRACLMKVLSVQTQEQPTAQLWILSPTASKRICHMWGAIEDPDYPGVYRLAAGLRAAFIVLHQLPRIPETLWLRLLGRGSAQQAAITELLALPPGDGMRENALELLGNWRIMLDQRQEALRQEERELLMNLSPAYLEWKEQTRSEGKQEGIQEGILQVAQNLLQMGMDPVQVATATGLSPEQIQQLQHCDQQS